MRYLLILLSFTLMAERHISSVITRIPKPGIGAPVILTDGEYSIVSLHSGLALGSQQFGEGKMASQSETTQPWNLEATTGGYFIGTAAGRLHERKNGEETYLEISADGTMFSVLSIEGSAAVEISDQGGRLLQVDWRTLPGGWVSVGERSNSSNQEWLVSRPTAEVAHAPAIMAHVRRHTNVSTGTTQARQSITWSKNGDAYVYRMHVTGGGLAHVRIDSGAQFDAAEVSTPAGWSFALNSWFAAKPANGGEFALRSTWAPGPVIVSLVPAGEMGVIFDGKETSAEQAALSGAHVFRGAHKWAIGPALAPGADLRAAAAGWMSEGLAFLYPLADKSLTIEQALDAVRPGDKFEREVLAVLRGAK